MSSSSPTLFAHHLNGRNFALFVAFQVLLMGALILASDQQRIVLFIALGSVAAAVFLAFLVIYPWLSIPLLLSTTAIDITGRLIKETPLGIPLTGFHLALVLMALALLTNIALEKRFTLPPFGLLGPLFLFWGVMAISQIYTPNQPEAAIGLLRTLFLILFLYAIEILVDSRWAVTTAILSIAACLVVVSILGVIQVFTEEFYLPASFVIAVGANTPRATGTFHNPNHLGAFLMSGIVFLTTLLIHFRMANWKRLLLLAVLGISMAGLVVSFSRGNWLATLLGIVVALWLAKKLRYLFFAGILFFLGILALKEFVPFAEHIFQRFISIFTIFNEFGSTGHVSGSARVQFVQAGLGMLLDNPVLGAGWRAFPVILDAYKPENFPHWLPTRESHTLFATIAAELGLVGLGAAGWIVWRVLQRGFAARRHLQDEYLRAVLTSLLAVFIAFQISHSFTGDFSDNFLWFYTGMLFGVIRLAQRSQDTAAQ
ncbi:MAG: hypothetical protein GKR89_19430 [Candidatus Latescibacteria bacterium]|nr:hypothetical protein [Candidatus Latescibacterota bacterium]